MSLKQLLTMFRSARSIFVRIHITKVKREGGERGRPFMRTGMTGLQADPQAVSLSMVATLFNRCTAILYLSYLSLKSVLNNILKLIQNAVLNQF